MRDLPRIPCLLVAALAAAGLLASTAGALADATAGGTDTTAQTGGAQYGAAIGETGTAELHARPAALLGRTLHLRGTAPAGSTVLVQRRDPHLGWLTAARATAAGDGTYLARWRTDHIGVFTLRAVSAGAGRVHASRAPQTIQVTVFKPALATWYGPGFYGHRTACGVRLTRDLVGVAHRGLPCGRQVALLYRGRTIIAPVVDRGPFAHGADWDLTAAAARALGFGTTDRIGAVSLHPAPAARRG